MSLTLALHPGLFFQGVAAEKTIRRRPASRVDDIAASGRRPVAFSEETDEFFRWLLGRAGLPAGRYRVSALARRLPACLRHLGVRTVGDARRKLEPRPDLQAALLDVVLLGVTEFFRDPPVFAALRETALPALFGRGARPRIWCPACSDGQELYSIALLLAECGRLGDCELLGTDCRPRAIAAARLGRYRDDLLDDLPPALRTVHFAAERGRARVRDRLGAATAWKVSNLLTRAEPGPWDLISWRNMAIYLDPPAANEIWNRLFQELAPGGWLVAGKAEHPPPALGFERAGPCLYRKRSLAA